MTFLEILRHPITSLPVIQKGGSDFRSNIRDLFRQFGRIVEESDDLSGPVNGSPFHSEKFKVKIKMLLEGILKTIDAYYEGRPHKAYEVLAQTLREARTSGYLDKELYLDRDSNFFRIRLQNGNYPLDSKDLFHIPFEKRGKTATQRFSIPGLPSLYLSNSVYVAWEEMLRPNFDSIQAIRLTNTSVLRMLDLATDIYVRNGHLKDNHSHGWMLLYKVMIWPLVAACSFKVEDRASTFRSEYIIPQLLLQWINLEVLDGILYSSTHINTLHGQGRFYNLVLPVKTFNCDNGHCKHLISMFKVTDVLPMQLRQFASYSTTLQGQSSIPSNVNPDIETIDLIRNNPQPYGSTYFGMLEHSLRKLALKSLA